LEAHRTQLFFILITLFVHRTNGLLCFPLRCSGNNGKWNRLSKSSLLHMNSAENTLKGYDNFIRVNPASDKISAMKFDHVEFYTGDATCTYKRFCYGLGMELVSKSDFSTGNFNHCSYLLQSAGVKMLFTAPLPTNRNDNPTLGSTLPGYNATFANEFLFKHGLAVRAIGIVVENLKASYETMISNGAVTVLAPTFMSDESNNNNGYVEMAELQLYEDVVLRLIERTNFKGHFLPHFKDLIRNPQIEENNIGRYGIQRFDHIVGNVYSLSNAMKYIKQITGFHDFAEFVAEDVGTVDSGLNSVVLANNNEFILLPLNEPTYGTKRKSQIQTYLEQNHGEGVQHMALFSRDIFKTMKYMRAATEFGGFEFMDPQPASYYLNLRNRIGDSLTEEEYQQVQELGLLVDKDDQGVLLQIFTKPLGDRPTIFIEIIQRLGCLETDGSQRPGCGGFGKGNFKDLFKSIEDYEKSLNI